MMPYSIKIYKEKSVLHENNILRRVKNNGGILSIKV